MKSNVLKTEAVIQTLISLAGLIYCLIQYISEGDKGAIFIALFFIGISNLLGFLIRICTVASIFHRYYFFGVLTFFFIVILVIRLTAYSDNNFSIYFTFVAGSLLNIYYVLYGLYVSKKCQ